MTLSLDRRKDDRQPRGPQNLRLWVFPSGSAPYNRWLNDKMRQCAAVQRYGKISEANPGCDLVSLNFSDEMP